MPLENVLAGFTATGFATIAPTIPGLQALGFFGTTMGGNNANRVSGGATFVNLTNPPTFGTAWGTVNNGSTNTPTQGIDSGVVETSGVVTSGWTIFCVARYTPVSGNATVMGIGTGQSTALTVNPANSLASNHATLGIGCTGLSFSPASDSVIDLGAGASLAGWRMFGLSYPAGAGARPYTLYDVTGNASRTTTTTHSRVGGASNHFTFGNAGGATPGGVFAQCDSAVAGIATGVLSLATQHDTIRPWLRGMMSFRGVTGF